LVPSSIALAMGSVSLLAHSQAAAYTLPVNLGQVSNPAVLKGNKDLELPGLNAAQQSALSLE
ncbi:hypothetical protein, partial [Proteus mirabilis]|uniref:hypothetical protein n=1 Tax=Proteus mirabilis TaxID=584 RepID=UPI0019539463